MMANPSEAYSRKRELDHIKNQIKDDQAFAKELTGLYNQRMQACQKEIEAFIGRYATEEGLSYADAMKKVQAVDVRAFEQKAAEYVKNRDFSDRANERLRLYNAKMRVSRLELLKRELNLALVDLANVEEKKLSDRLQKKAIEEIERQAGILGMSVRDRRSIQAAASVFVKADFRSATFSDRVWANQGWLQSRLANGLERSLLSGEHPRLWARRLKGIFQKDFKGASSAAARLAVTETARVQAAVQQASRERMGFDRYEYVAEPSACPICKPMDEQVFMTKDMVIGRNHFPMHPWCRCSSAAFLDVDQFKISVDGYEGLHRKA